MVKKTIGKNTLGDSNKMKVAMRDYERSTHNLSYIWRSSYRDWETHKRRGQIGRAHV